MGSHLYRVDHLSRRLGRTLGPPTWSVKGGQDVVLATTCTAAQSQWYQKCSSDKAHSKTFQYAFNNRLM